jgi:hypothetical protein
MRWQIKRLADNCEGLIPFQNATRKLRRRVVPYHPCLSRRAYAISEGLMQIQWLRDAIAIKAFKLPEPGTPSTNL